MRHSMEFYRTRTRPNAAIQHWGFRPGEAAFTHTIAYTIRGFWETGLVHTRRKIDAHCNRFDGAIAGNQGKKRENGRAIQRRLVGRLLLSVSNRQCPIEHNLQPNVCAPWVEAGDLQKPPAVYWKKSFPFNAKAGFSICKGPFPARTSMGPLYAVQLPELGGKIFFRCSGINSSE